MNEQNEIDMSVRQFREGHPQSIIAKLKDRITVLERAVKWQETKYFDQRKSLEALWKVSCALEGFEKETKFELDEEYYKIEDIFTDSDTLDQFITAIAEVDDVDNAE